MIAETGLFALILALLVAAVQSVLPLAGAAKTDATWMRLASFAATAQFALVSIALAALIWLHVSSDFSVLNVVQHSHSDKPLLYKITGVWGNHEGSMLLWVFILTLYGLALALFGGRLPSALRARVLAVQGMIGFGFLLFILATSNPFARVANPPWNGNGLNPLLQDPGLAFHPPFLYLGYVGFSLAFSFAIAALIEGRVDAAWARWVRPWTLAAWSTLTLGIAMGSWWSYYTLGWGGFWAWDPVENASLMPWLAGTALLHSAIVAEKRDTLKGWTIFLAIATFSLALLGTFLVRSGVLTSVHAFANDPARGRFILLLLGTITGGSLALFGLRAGSLKAGGIFSPLSREGSLLFNNLFLSTATATVFIGTLAPLFADLLHLDKLSVGAPYFNRMIGLLFVPLVIAMPIGPLLAWKRGNLQQALQRLSFAALTALATIVITLFAAGIARHNILAATGLGLAVWLAAGTLRAWLAQAGLRHRSWRGALHAILHMPRAAHGMALAHFGMAMLVAGITGASAWQSETLAVLHPGEAAGIAGYTVRFVGVDENIRGANYTAERGTFLAEKNGRSVAVLSPERRLYDNPPEPKSTVAIHTDFFSDLYVVLGSGDAKSGYVVHLFHNPLVPWIFIGALVMVLGGLFSLCDRRARIGMTERATASPAPASAIWRYALPALASLALIGIFVWRLNQTSEGDAPAVLPSALIGKPAPTVSLPPLHPGTPGLRNADLKGHITLVNFFASWCAPCRAEAPLLQKLKDQQIMLIGIAYKDKNQAAETFLAETGNPYSRVATDSDGKTGLNFGLSGVPETFVIDPSGIVRYRYAGPLTEEALRREILPLLETLR